MPQDRRRVILLGSTGSIGCNVLHALEHLRDHAGMTFELVGLAAGTNAQRVSAQARRCGVKHIALAEDTNADQLDVDANAQTYVGDDAALQLIERVAQRGDLVVAAMVGSAGLPAVLAAIERGCDIALANKETLVAAGALVIPAVEQAGVHLLPVDSEHSAIFQCLAGDRSPDDVRRLMITASGGPFRTWSAERTFNATVEQALRR